MGKFEERIVRAKSHKAWRRNPANFIMPPSLSNDSWFFISVQELDQQHSRAEKKRQNASRKQVVESGVGKVWVNSGPEDFVEVSWEDALLPPNECHEDSREGERCSTGKEEREAPTPKVLHPHVESPWQGMKPGRKNDAPRFRTNNIINQHMPRGRR